MATEEIDKFVRKFKDLWKLGFDAHLDVDAHAGEAWVGLRVRIGRAQGVPYPKSEGSSPARERRRVRRAAVRKEQSDRIVKEEELEESDESFVTEEVAVQINDIVQLTQENGEADENSATTEEVAAKIEIVCQEAETAGKEEVENVNEYKDVVAEEADKMTEKAKIVDEKIKKEEDFTAFFSFRSKSSEEVISESLKTIFPPDGATDTTLVLREWLGPRTNEHLCTLKVHTPDQNISWPTMEASLVDVFREARRLR